jgi:hypothetical protein
MKKTIFKGASFLLLALTLPAIGWSLKENVEISNSPIQPELVQTPVVSQAVSAEELFTQHISEIYIAG